MSQAKRAFRGGGLHRKAASSQGSHNRFVHHQMVQDALNQDILGEQTAFDTLWHTYFAYRGLISAKFAEITFYERQESS